MKRINLEKMVFVLFVAMLVLTGNVSATRKTVAVMPVENAVGGSYDNVAEVMTEQLVSALNNSGSFVVAERLQLGAVMQEIGFQATGAVDPNQAVQLGQMTGAQYSLLGKVTMAEVTQNQTGVIMDTLFTNTGFGVSRYVGQNRGKVSVNVRLIDNRTGHCVASFQVDGAKAGNDRRVAIHGACREAAGKVLKEISRQNPAVAFIMDIDVTTNLIYIDQGAESGIRKGDKFILIREGQALTNQAGEVVGNRYQVLGKAVVEQLESGYAVCRITEQSTFIQRGDFAKKG